MNIESIDIRGEIYYQDRYGAIYLPDLTVRGWLELYNDSEITLERQNRFPNAKKAAKLKNTKLYKVLK